VGGIGPRDGRRLRGGAALKPVLFVTNHVPPARVGAFAALRERVPLELVTFGGRTRHGGAPTKTVPPTRAVRERDVHRLAARGEWSAVVCGTAGRVALPGAYTGAHRAGVPFVLWASLWAHPLTAAHALSYAPLLAIYRGADAVVTYGEHVSDYVARRGAHRIHVAPQAVDNEFWSAAAGPLPPDFEPRGFMALFAGREAPEKGLEVLERAWRASAPPPDARLVIASDLDPEQLRNFYAAAHVLVMPSLRTRDFREPWGLVANEAMNQRTAIIASDEVGAAAGGLVRHERNGLIVPAGDAEALAGAVMRLREDAELRDALADNGTRDVAAFTHEAWAAGFVAALREVGAC
jgi:glycosyltransferase involved in cell wall biosynthesis